MTEATSPPRPRARGGSRGCRTPFASFGPECRFTASVHVIPSSTGLAHSKKAAGRSEEVPTLSTQRAKLVSPCSKVVRLHRLTFGEEVTNELDQTMTVGALFEARIGDRKRADFCNPEPRGTEAWYKGLRQPGMSTMPLPGSPNPHHPILIRGDPGHAVPIRIHD